MRLTIRIEETPTSVELVVVLLHAVPARGTAAAATRTSAAACGRRLTTSPAAVERAVNRWVASRFMGGLRRGDGPQARLHGARPAPRVEAPSFQSLSVDLCTSTAVGGPQLGGCAPQLRARFSIQPGRSVREHGSSFLEPVLSVLDEGWSSLNEGPIVLHEG